MASKGKRLFALLIDFVFIVLLVNTCLQLFKKEHWDLHTAYGWEHYFPIYASITVFMILKDIFFGQSLGKIIFGMHICRLQGFKQTSLSQRILRNFTLLILPIDGLILLFDPYARRLGDKIAQTVVLDKQNAIKPMQRILLANLIFFFFFFSAWMIQPKTLTKTAAYQVSIQHIETYAPLIKELGLIQKLKILNYNFPLVPKQLIHHLSE